MKRVDTSSALHTLDAWVDLSSGLVGTNGLVVPIALEWFKHFGQMGTFYRYCSVLSYKFDFTLSTTQSTQDSLYGAAIAFYPVNPLIEGNSFSVPTTLADVQCIDGAIMIQPGYRNSSKWVKIAAPATYATNQFIGTTLGVGSFLAYANDLGPSETLGQARLSLNIRFWEKRFAPSAGGVTETVSTIEYAPNKSSVTGTDGPLRKSAPPSAKQSFISPLRKIFSFFCRRRASNSSDC